MSTPQQKDSNTSSDWWPAPLAHVPHFDPWAESDVVIAEILSFGDGTHTGHRRVFSALVPIGDLEAIKASLAKFDQEVSASGPHPWPQTDAPYDPKFWIRAHGLPKDQYEPLVLSWTSHDKTTLQLDPRFLMTYGLAPRNLGEGRVHWDDPAAPLPDVVKISSPSVWEFPRATSARVSVRKDYLQDYLTLRQAALVLVYWEMRWGQADQAIEQRLGKKEALEVALPDRRFLIRRSWDAPKIVSAQVHGARVVAVPGPLPVSENSLEKDGLVWPGISEVVTEDVASRMTAADVVYVSDAVLGAYEGEPGYRINPNSGSVTFGTQWGVAFCDRLGRNLIQVELKKLYEGVPPHVTRYWHRYAIDPPSHTALIELAKEENVATRSKQLAYGTIALGESLSQLAGAARLQGLEPEYFVGLRRQSVDYSGWWTLDLVEPIGRHIPLELALDGFLDRCLALNKLIIEGLAESGLRLTLRALGVPAEDIEEFASLKLLDRLVCMAQVAYRAGLELPLQGKQVWERLQKEGTTPPQPIAHLFALYDIRTIAAHKTSDRRQRLLEELKRFGIAAGEEQAGYGRILDVIYDRVAKDLTDARVKIDAALQICNPLVTPGSDASGGQADLHRSEGPQQRSKAGGRRRRRLREKIGREMAQEAAHSPQEFTHLNQATQAREDQAVGRRRRRGRRGGRRNRRPLTKPEERG